VRSTASRRMDARHPKSGLPDFGTKIAEIGNSRFRLLAAILRDASIEIGCCRFRHFRACLGQVEPHSVMAGLVPAIPIIFAVKRDPRDKPAGDAAKWASC